MKDIKDNVDFKINDSFGLYLHIPFCEGKCRYCDFYSENFNNTLLDKFLDCLKNEIVKYALILENNGTNLSQLETIYIGGGTPGLLEVDQLDRILNLIFDKFSYPIDSEITIEANPCSLTEEKIVGYKGVGVSRISLGIQSFYDNELNFLGRKHTSEEAVKKISLVNKYFDNYNIDLIFAIPGQKVNTWQHTLEKAISINPRHISLYNLQIEEGTPLYKSMEAGDFAMVDDSTDAEMYLLAREMLVKNGYRHYEISNFSYPNFQSKHNRIYWELKPYLGLGPGAHSFTGKLRFNNYADINKYNELLKTPKSAKYIDENTILPIENIIKLSKEDLIAEKLFMGLRLLEGISLNAFQNQFGINIEKYYSSQVSKLSSMNLIEIKDGRIKLTEKGVLHGNRVFMEFLPI